MLDAATAPIRLFDGREGQKEYHPYSR